MPRKSTVEEMIKPCGGTCGRMTRPSRWPAEKFPDTVVRATGSLCHKCRDAAGINPTRPPKPRRDITEESIENISANLQHWQARRRRDAERLRTRHLTY